MDNPGLRSFAAETAYARRPWHADPDVDEEEEDVADPPYKEPPYFSDRAHSQGYATHEVIPAIAGKRLDPDTAKNVIHGEIIHPDEEAGADDILGGGSSHPGVAEFRHHLGDNPGARNAVNALSHLVSGGSPRTATDYDEARDYLRTRFRQVTANPQHGTLVVRGKSTQVVKRKDQDGAEPTYELENKHGIFEYPTPDRTITAMMAFEFINHERDYKKEKEKEEEDDQQQQRVSGWFGKSTPNSVIPEGAVFEPYAGGLDSGTVQVQGPKGHTVNRSARGGYVMDTPASIPPGSPLENWVHHGGVSYSPGHPEGWRHDPTLGSIPRPDRFAQGHTFTYFPTSTHTVQRQDKEGNQYYVRPSHPQVRQGINVPPKPKVPKAPPAARFPKAAPGTVTPTAPVSAIPASATPAPGAPPPPTAYGVPPVTSAVQSNDLCPVCVSGYVESDPYDSDHYTCLNCGSALSKNAAARPRGGLGRGLGEIKDPGASAVGMGLNEDGSAKVVDPTAAQDKRDGDPNTPDEKPPSGYHPLHGQQLPEDHEGYQAPKRILGAAEPVDLDKHLLENYGMHRQESYQEGAGPAYMGPVPGRSGVMATLRQQMPDKQGRPGKWVLGVGNVQPPQTGKLQFDTFENVEHPTDLTDKRMVVRVPPTREGPATQFNVLAQGWHPVNDEHFAGEIHRLMNPETGGMSSWPVRRTRETPFYPKEQPAPPHESEGVFAEPFNRNEQKRLRELSSVENPGVSRFIS